MRVRILRQLTIAHIHGNCRSFCQEQLTHIIESILPFLLSFQEQVIVIIEATLLWLTAPLHLLVYWIARLWLTAGNCLLVDLGGRSHFRLD